MSEQLASSISWPLLGIVIAWAMLLFCGFGLLSGLNPTSVVAMAFGAFAVASAIFLILELNQPFSGIFRVPSASIEATLQALEALPTKD
jgi:signal peptidase I